MNKKQILFMNFMISLVFSIAMGFFMLLIYTGGIMPGFLTSWLSSTLIGFVVAFPLSLIIVPPIQKLSLNLFNQSVHTRTIKYR
ncbi:DUF2798 domain-containing protein [Desulfitobacterium chlororespirans]|uniref:DUF2798 domain-containing protein n=1 Tax=Desulfitobacterium chlororespirans DSM 11544 TaxID=1121395 RepID=A0A1M7UZQ7_9FIRM|nr:DUF2798 domain-containing protein [Desulfitobacterium chlororespirans]SHN88511.1 Protein of unknown function [Desulfitobacterium chlororespirans DSM 11544]